MKTKFKKHNNKKQNRKQTNALNAPPLRRLWNVTAQPLPALSMDRPQDDRVFKYVHTYDYGTLLTTSTTLVTTAGSAFTLTQVPQSANYINIYDQYRFTRIEVWLQPQAFNNGGHAGMLYSAVDYDSIPTLTVSSIQEYSTVAVAPVASTGHYHSFTPRLAVAASGGGLFTSYANLPPQWIDCASATVEHYGIVLVAGISTDVIPIDMLIRYHVEFRNVR